MPATGTSTVEPTTIPGTTADDSGCAGSTGIATDWRYCSPSAATVAARISGDTRPSSCWSVDWSRKPTVLDPPDCHRKTSRDDPVVWSMEKRSKRRDWASVGVDAGDASSVRRACCVDWALSWSSSAARRS